MSRQGSKFSELVGDRMAAYPCSGEINYWVGDSKAVQAHYAGQNLKVDATDELSLGFDDWWMNIRASNTESLLRLNIEAQSCADKVLRELATIQTLIWP